MLESEDRRKLLGVARDSIAFGLHAGKPLTVDPSRYGQQLAQPGATFVTLKRHDVLRGCIGTLDGVRPIVADVARHAYGAAFKDPRFPAVAPGEVDELQIHISLLSKAMPLAFASEQELLSQLSAGIDGLILQSGSRRATFLPSVWEQLSDPGQFLGHLKQKAGLDPTQPAQDLKVWRYTAESVVG